MLDFHCHLSDVRIFDQAPGLIANAVERGVTRFFLGGVEPSEWTRQFELKQIYPNQIFTSVGIHPWTLSQPWAHKEENRHARLVGLASALKDADALGETGLHFGRDLKPAHRLWQTEVFFESLKLANDQTKPVVLHAVGAHAEVIQQLKVFPKVQFVLHRFSGSLSVMTEYLKLGAYFSICGGRSGSPIPIPPVVQSIPLDRLFLESDAPDGLLVPASIHDFYLKMAEFRGISVESLLKIIDENFERFRYP